MKIFFTFLTAFLVCQLSFSQVTFTNASTLLDDANITSGVAIGVADMNGDGLDDIVRLQNSRFVKIGYQREDGTKFDSYTPNFANNSNWSLCIADIDRNGYNDILTGGAYNNGKLLYFDSLGVDTILDLPSSDIFFQGSNLVDINNDGSIDIYVCHDDGTSRAYRNSGNRNFTYDTNLIETVSTNPSDNSGNYGSIWTDYDSDGDIDLYLSKCRLGVDDTLDGRRVNQLWENDGNNNYTDVAVTKGIVPYGQSWSTDFADIDNDGDWDAFVINHDKISTFYENIGDSMFIDITGSTGVTVELIDLNVGIQTIFEDFDNDGFIDLLLTGIGDYFLFKNNGDKTFTNLNNAFPGTTPNIQSAAVGDLNNDGFLDVLAGFANGYNSPSTLKDRLLMNNGNDNHWVKVRLKGMTSNINGIGARLELYSALGKQIREVRSGEGYGIMNSLTTHFGVSTITDIDSIVVTWPSGIRDVVCAPDTNTTLLLTESCKPNCEGLVLNLNETICKGESYLFDGIERIETGIYTINTNNGIGCDSAVILDLKVIEIDNTVTYNDMETTLTANQNEATYQWYNCNNNTLTSIDEATDISYQTEVDGDFAVEITKEGCSDTSTCISVEIVTSLENLFSFDINVFPNPIKDLLTVELSVVKKQINVQLFDLAGQLKMDENYNNHSQVQLSTIALPKGVYLLKISIDGEVGSIKMIKQ